MSLALKFGDFKTGEDSHTSWGFIYIDAVTQYVRDFKGQVTSHPIGSGGLISDHFIRSNPVYQLTGVISGADISLGLGVLDDGTEEQNRPENLRGDISAVKIKGTNNSLLSLIPNSLTRFFVDSQSNIKVSSKQDFPLSSVRGVLENLFSVDGITTVKLFEYKGTKLSRVIDNLVMNSLSFTEEPDSGDALYIHITLEQVSFVELQTRKLDKKEFNLNNVSDKLKDKDVKNQAAPKVDKGNEPEKGSILKRMFTASQETKNTVLDAITPLGATSEDTVSKIADVLLEGE